MDKKLREKVAKLVFQESFEVEDHALDSIWGELVNEGKEQYGKEKSNMVGLPTKS